MGASGCGRLGFEAKNVPFGKPGQNVSLSNRFDRAEWTIDLAFVGDPGLLQLPLPYISKGPERTDKLSGFGSGLSLIKVPNRGEENFTCSLPGAILPCPGLLVF